MSLNHRKKELRCFNTKSLVTELYFLQETHSSEDALNKRQGGFQGQILFLLELRILVV